MDLKLECLDLLVEALDLGIALVAFLFCGRKVTFRLLQLLEYLCIDRLLSLKDTRRLCQ